MVHRNAPVFRPKYFKGCVAVLSFCVWAGGPAAAQTPASSPATAPARCELTAVRVPDGAIKIDGSGDDWQGIDPAALERCNWAPDPNSHWVELDAARGKWAGPDDCSVILHFAHDSNNLYILAEVHDQFLVSDANENTPFMGDDIEFFIDANPPESRFADKPNENVRQLIFVPGHINPKWPNVFIWPKDQPVMPQAVSHLQPWGYTMSIKIPKASFPYWKEHPEMASIGFDGHVSDADAPGIDIHHPATKGAFVFCHYEKHWTTPRFLSTLKLQGESSGPQAYSSVHHQTLLECIDEPNARMSEHAGEYLVGHPEMSKEALEVFAFHPELDAPINKITSLAQSLIESNDLASHAAAQYALETLALRKKMPVRADWAKTISDSNDPQLQLTYAWCCGVNGDAAAVPVMIDWLANSPNHRVRMMAALSLGVLGDQAAVAPLTEAAKDDKSGEVKMQAKDSLKKLGSPYPEPPPASKPAGK